MDHETRTDLLAIGEVARLSQVSVKALRHYHERGLLVPAVVDATTGYRSYAPEQLRTATVIRALRGVDMPLDEIAEVLTAEPDRVGELLAAHRARLAARLAETGHRITLIEALITEEIDTMYDITIEDVPAVRVAREHLEVPSHLSAVTEAATLASLATRMLQQGTAPAAPPVLVIHHADEHRTDEDACLPVAVDAELGPEFDVVTLPGGPMATATHVGPLDDLVLVVNAVMGWVAGRGYRVRAPFRVELRSIPPLFTVEDAGGGDRPVAKVLVPFD